MGGWMEGLSDEQRNDLILRWFGKQQNWVPHQDLDDQAGGLIFFDALPIKAPQLVADVMTPHYGNWYEQGHSIQDAAKEPDKIPADWHDPVPVVFLAVKSASLLFCIAPRTPGAEKDAERALEELGKALAWLGAGAKTAAGYGHLQDDEKGLRELQEKIQQERESALEASRSPEEKVLQALRNGLEHAKASGKEKAGGPLYNRLGEEIKQAQNWSLAQRCVLADIGEKIYKLVGWGSGEKKKEK